MREFTIYGLDEGARLLSTERLALKDEVAARSAARARLEQFPRVELWEGPVCLSKKTRETHAPVEEDRKE